MNSDCSTARTLFRTLVDRRKKLQEQKANCKLDFEKFALNPEFYSAEKLSRFGRTIML